MKSNKIFFILLLSFLICASAYAQLSPVPMASPAPIQTPSPRFSPTSTPFGVKLSQATTAVKNTAIDAGTGTKKMVRTGKRKVRKAMGTDTVGKDIRDKVQDVGDDIDGARKKK